MAFAADDSLSLIPEGEQGAVSIALDVEGGSTDTFSHFESDAAASADGDGAATSSENALDKSSSTRIDQDVSPVFMAQRESSRSFFLAKTLGSMKSIPVVSADLPLDVMDGERANGSLEDQKEPRSSIATDSVVIGSFDRDGIIYAIEPGATSVAVVASDRSRMPSDWFDTQTITLAGEISVGSAESYPVSRIASDAFARSMTYAVASEEDPSSSEIDLDTMSNKAETQDDNAGSGDFVCTVDEDSERDVEGDERYGADPDITAIAIPASVIDIEDGAFAGFSTLKRIDVSSDNPMYDAYDNCLYSKSGNELLFIPEGYEGAVRIPSSVEKVSPDAFSRSPLVTSILVDSDNPMFASDDGLLYTKDKTALVRVPIARTDIDVDAGCTALGSRSLFGCADLETIEHLGSIRSISSDAFENVDRVTDRDLDPAEVLVVLANDDETLRAPWMHAGFVRFDVAEDQLTEMGMEEATETLAFSSIDDARAKEATSKEAFSESTIGETEIASTLATANPDTAVDTVNGFAYDDPVQLWIATSQSTVAPGIFGAFTGSVSWTSGDANGPSKGAIITVNVDKFTPWGDNTLTAELLAEKFIGSNHTGANGKVQKLDGFSTDTGCYISLDTLYSGRPFTFSYTIGTVVPPKKIKDAAESGAAVSSYAGCFVDKSCGVHWNESGEKLDPSPFIPRYVELSDHVGIRFDPNGGSWKSPVSDLTSTTSPHDTPGNQRNCRALVFSKKKSASGNALESPRTPLILTGKVFKGWFASTATNARRIKTLEEAIANGYVVYAQWEEQKGSFTYDDPVQLRLALGNNPLGVAFFGAFTGKASWTSGSVNGPTKGAIITLEIEAFTPWGDNTLSEEMLVGKFKGSNYTGSTGIASRLDGFMTDLGSYVSLETLFSGQSFAFSYTLGALTAPDESTSEGAPEPTYFGCFVDKTKGVCYQASSALAVGAPPFTAQYVDLVDHVGINFHPNNGSWKSPVSDLTSTTSPHAPAGYQRNCSALVFTQNTGTSTLLKTPQTPLVHDGMVFEGWYTESRGGTKVTTLGEAVANGHSVYAHWTPVSGSYVYNDPAQIRLAMGSDAVSMLFMGEFTGEVSWDKGGDSGPTKDAVVMVDIVSFSPFGDNVLTEELLADKYRSGDWKGASGSAQRAVGFATDRGTYVSFETLFSGDKFSFSFTMGTVVAPVDIVFDAAILPSFLGCFVDQDRGVVWQTGQGTSPEGTTVSAKADATPFTVRYESAVGECGVEFHPNGGSWKSPMNGNLSRKSPHAPNESRDVCAIAYSKRTLTTDNALISPSTPLVNGDKVFLGWFTAASGGSKAITLEQAQANGNLVYAHWGDAIKTRYGIVYDGNGATSGTTSPSYEYAGNPIKIAENGFQRIGYSFTGWKDDAGVSYAAGSTLVPSLAAGERLYLHAQWSPNLYRVTLSAPDATSKDHTKVYYQKYGMGAYEDSAGNAPLPVIVKPERKGWRFNGYWTEENGRGDRLIDADGNTPNQCETFSDDAGVLYAWWIKNLNVTVPVTFDHIALETVLDVDTNSLNSTTDVFTFENRSDGSIRIVSVEEDQGSDAQSRADHDARVAAALAVFGGPSSDDHRSRLDRLAKVHITMRPAGGDDSDTVHVAVDGTGDYVFPDPGVYPASWILAPGSLSAPKDFPIEFSLKFDPDYQTEHLDLNSRSKTIAKLVWTVDLLE